MNPNVEFHCVIYYDGLCDGMTQCSTEQMYVSQEVIAKDPEKIKQMAYEKVYDKYINGCDHKIKSISFYGFCVKELHKEWSFVR